MHPIILPDILTTLPSMTIQAADFPSGRELELSDTAADAIEPR